MQNKNRYLIMALFSLLIALGMFPLKGVSLPVNANVGDTLGIAFSGDFAGNLDLSGVESPQIFEQSATWTWVETEDYIFFRDSTSTAGFRINVYMSSVDNGNFVYSGSSSLQGNVDVSNFKIWANYDGGYIPATKGVDSDTAVLNVNSSVSCPDASDLFNFSFHEALLSASTDYGLTMSSAAQTYFSSSLDCEVEGTIDIRRMLLTYPEAANTGTYRAEFMIVIVDGSL